MRVVSTEGRCDVPYDGVLIWYQLNRGEATHYTVYASFLGHDTDITMAQYKNERNLFAELSRLHRAYLSAEKVIFRFRKEEDIERERTGL